MNDNKLLERYMRQHGWAADERGAMGSLWRNDRDAVIGVPSDISVGSLEWQGVVDRLASFEGRPVQAVAEQVELQMTDVVRLRAANEFVIKESIPFGAGVHLVNSAWQMLRASATTSIRPRPHIGGNFSKIADEIAARARLGHTERGSYVLPVLMELPAPGEESGMTAPLPGYELTPDTQLFARNWEAPERRVMRTLATALEAVATTIVGPVERPTPEALNRAVNVGASRELLVAIGRTFAGNSVVDFEARFEWAAGVDAPPGVTKIVRIPIDAVERLEYAAKRLRSVTRTPLEVITGPIVQVRHVPGDLFGEISIQTVLRGRQTAVHVRLREGKLPDAYNWARDGQAVLCQGAIRRSIGQPLLIEEPSAFYALDDTYLSAAGEPAEQVEQVKARSVKRPIRTLGPRREITGPRQSDD